MRYILATFILLLSFSAKAQVQNDQPESNTAEVQTEIKTAPQTEPNEEAEVYEIFSPRFMKSLSKCKADAEEQEINGERQRVEIIEKKQDLCHLFYEGFNMYVPSDVLPSIHGFNELRTLLKNQDITQYEFTPKYSYQGLLYALDSCQKNVDYGGEQIVEQKGDITVSRTLYSEYANNNCAIYLESKMYLDGNENDYTIICNLNGKMLKTLLSFYTDILAKYGAKREFSADGRIRQKSAEQNKETNQADEEIMYYLQQKGFCLRPEL